MECGTKIRYQTRDDALEEIKALLWKNHSRGQGHRSVGLHPYPCPHCEHWHVGHEQGAPLVWHYTLMAYMDRILDADCLKPGAPKRVPRKLLRQMTQPEIVHAKQAEEPVPLLWFSRNSEWEYSVMKVKGRDTSRMRNEIAGRGCVRFGIPACFAKLRWSDYLKKNPTPRKLQDAMALRGNPTEWLATDEPIPLSRVRTIEVYYRGWKPVADVDDAEFDIYINQRAHEYAEASFILRAVATAAIEAGHTMDDIGTGFTEAERIVFADWKVRCKLKGETRLER